jgi:uncharacterized protein with GYD domain
MIDPYNTLQTAGNVSRLDEENMHHILCQATHTASAINAQINNPVNREEAVRKLIETADSKLHSMFNSYGEYDALILSAGADEKIIGTMAFVNASGAFKKVEMTRLYNGSENISTFKNSARTQLSHQPAER